MVVIVIMVNQSRVLKGKEKYVMNLLSVMDIILLPSILTVLYPVLKQIIVLSFKE